MTTIIASNAVPKLYFCFNIVSISDVSY